MYYVTVTFQFFGTDAVIQPSKENTVAVWTKAKQALDVLLGVENYPKRAE
jgi:hypothetical protein